MTGPELGVLLGGITAIAAVNWWFFKAEARSANVAPGPITVVVRGGYSPQTIRIKSGAPARVIFDRQETDSCSEEIVFPDFGIRKFLPPNEQTTIELPAAQPGTYDFMCGMSMMRGRVVVE